MIFYFRQPSAVPFLSYFFYFTFFCYYFLFCKGFILLVAKSSQSTFNTSDVTSGVTTNDTFYQKSLFHSSSLYIIYVSRMLKNTRMSVYKFVFFADVVRMDRWENNDLLLY